MKKRMMRCIGLCVFIIGLLAGGQLGTSVEQPLQKTQSELSVDGQSEIAFFSLRDAKEHRERTVDCGWNTEDFKRCLELLYAISEDSPAKAGRYSLTVFYEDSTKLSESYYIDEEYAEICEDMLKPGWTAL